jgi:hypothetical protein
LAQHFGKILVRFAKGRTKPNTCCWLTRYFHWSRWVAVSSFPPFAVAVSVLWMTLGINK